MNDAHAPRRAYFASLSTPDLIVCCTVERSRYEASDLDLIRQELVKRGVNVDRLAIPGPPPGEVLGITPAAFTGPLPGAVRWWGEGWSLFTRHLRFVAALAAVLTLPLMILSGALEHTHDGDLSVGFIAHVLFLVAFDALLTSALFNGLHRRMTEGRGSVGRALANGLQCWGRVFRESLKAVGLAFGLPLFMFSLGVKDDVEGLKVWAWLLAIYPGSYLFLRVFWVQALAICKRGDNQIFRQSRRFAKGRILSMYWFLIVTLTVMLLGILATMIVKAILPKPALEPIGVYFAGCLMLSLVKTTILVGFFHVSAYPDARPAGSEASALPQPPGLEPGH